MEKKKGPWHLAREKVQEEVMRRCKSLGYTHVTPSFVSPKTLKDNPAHVLIQGYEFTGKTVFILFDKLWNDLVDINNNPTRELVLYIIAPCKNYDDVYTSTEMHDGGPYIVPITDLRQIAVRPGFSEIPPEIEIPSFTEERGDDYSEKDDDHINNMTIRDFYAITSNQPVSNKRWLNNLIKTTK